MAIEDRFKDVAIEIEGQATSNIAEKCDHPNSKEVRTIELPMKGIQIYYLCRDCDSQWQEIVERKANVQVQE